MIPCTLNLNGAKVELLPEGALWWPSERLMAVADLHFEKGSAYGVRGQFLPPYDTRVTIARLAALARLHEPKTIVALGDSFHDVKGPDRLDPDDRAALEALTGARAFVWITGNHDADAAAACGGRAAETFVQGRLIFRHEPAAGVAAGEVCGHLHPKAGVNLKGRYISRPCYVSDGRRMVMPAFGAFTGGLNVFDAAFFPVFPDGFTAYLLGKGRVYPFASRQLQGRAVA